MSFVGLHIHSDYSLLDGASQLPPLVDQAIELGMPAIALTDHGVMYGAIELIKVCKAKGIKPIIGNEMYIINGDIENTPKRIKKYHQVTLAKNDQGYKNLVKLTTVSHLKGVKGSGIFSRPCIDKGLLAQYHEGLIITSACLGGEIPQAILQNKPDVARQVARWYKDLLGEDYYIEIQDHGSPEDRVVNVELVKIARELDIQIVATNDSHFISCQDVEAHDALLCIQTGKLLTEEKRLRYSGTEYLKSAEEMAQLFRDHLPQDVVDEAIATTVTVADKVETYSILGEPRIPDYPIPEGYTNETFMSKVARDGIVERFKLNNYDELTQDYRDRMEYEIDMMHKMGFAAYFLVVWDYIKYARDQNIPVGPGRGSAAGSIVAYAMGITNIDPVHYGLLFERFLNPERKSMPDVDTDFCIERRGEVIDYVTEKYGTERVAQIITFNRMTSKAVLKDTARVLDVPYADADKMAKLIPISRGKPTKLKVMISDDTPMQEFKDRYDSDSQTKRWVDMAIRIEGMNKSFGVHAAGVVISKDPLDEIVPLQLNKDGAPITQYYMEDVEAMGLLKMDFLGLKNLTMIQKTCDLVEEATGEHIDPDEIDLDDPEVYQLLARGDLEGVFQLESSGMQQIVRDLKPSNVTDISSVLALYRPGPLDAGLIPKFINRKHGREQIDFPDNILKPILTETYGIMVYQEQIMRIAQDMGGYSLGEADLLRRAMGKKKISEMEKHQSIFCDGASKKGVDTKVSRALWDDMVLFAAYCFNKSHSAAYAYVTYQTAYLKARYPVQYMASLLTVNSGQQDKVQRYIANCIAMGIEVELPHINRSAVDFTPVGTNIVFGLGAIRNVGMSAVESIIAERKENGEFSSLADLCDRIDSRTVNSRALEALIHSGALDELEPNANRHQMSKDLPLVLSWAQSRAKDKESGQGNLFDLMGGGDASGASGGGLDMAPKASRVAEYDSQERLKLEKELLGFYVSDHPLKSVQKSARMLAPINLVDAERYISSGGGGGQKGRGNKDNQPSVSAIVMLPEVKIVTTKKSGEQMAIITIEDLSAQIAGVVFPRSYARIKDAIKQDARLMVWGKIDRRDENVQFIVDDAEPIEDIQMVMVNIPLQSATDIMEQQRLKGLLQAQQGPEKEDNKVPVVAVLQSGNQRHLVRFGSQFRVQDPDSAVRALRDASFEAEARHLIQAR